MSRRDDVRRHIDAIEEAYEYFLAYAAQGLSGDGAGPEGSQIRAFLEGAAEAAGDVGPAVRDVVRDEGLEPEEAWTDVVQVLERDARASLAALRLVASRPAVSSQIIDNLNANIHLRALLTDLFLVDDLLG